MVIRFKYVTVEVDDTLRERFFDAGERLRRRIWGVTAILRSAGDDVEEAGGKVRHLCDTAAARVDAAIAGVNGRIAPEFTVEPPNPARPPTLRVV
ncbi:MAG: hypothetical protein ACSLE6_06290 [Mycobacterium sp.]